jgi:hypothetical protein
MALLMALTDAVALPAMSTERERPMKLFSGCQDQ